MESNVIPSYKFKRERVAYTPCPSYNVSEVFNLYMNEWFTNLKSDTDKEKDWLIWSIDN